VDRAETEEGVGEEEVDVVVEEAARAISGSPTRTIERSCRR
jgi:hypothetical protein